MPYLKAALIERTAASERTVRQRLLSSEYLGVLREMTQLLGTSSQTFDNPVVPELFPQRLPSQFESCLLQPQPWTRHHWLTR
ncbi:hypothetical protein HPB50_006576 [Hyalomma asiaticum]|uniref:Uncharacterized protein n=1 Tax=Hyalomma asiaticum TaxID=266040 RepID=A0ACB7SLF8_HYAAI|nr:hypothetical protein HPB50_006576 [Hyalomma asiaticum]